MNVAKAANTARVVGRGNSDISQVHVIPPLVTRRQAIMMVKVPHNRAIAVIIRQIRMIDVTVINNPASRMVALDRDAVSQNQTIVAAERMARIGHTATTAHQVTGTNNQIIAASMLADPSLMQHMDLIEIMAITSRVLVVTAHVMVSRGIANTSLIRHIGLVEVTAITSLRHIMASDRVMVALDQDMVSRGVVLITTSPIHRIVRGHLTEITLVRHIVGSTRVIVALDQDTVSPDVDMINASPIHHIDRDDFMGIIL